MPLIGRQVAAATSPACSRATVFQINFRGTRRGNTLFIRSATSLALFKRDQRYISEANNYITTPTCSTKFEVSPCRRERSTSPRSAKRSDQTDGVITTKPAVIDNNTAGVKAMMAKSSDEFLFYLWSNVSLIDHAGGVVPAVSKSALENVPLCYPGDPEEQQKIADCLGSLDDLIAAEGRKLGALRQHKQGLMQQLFPQPGENVPSLRFPLFRDKGEWKESKAGSLFANRVSKGEDGLPIYSVTMHDGMVRRDSLDRNYNDIEEAAGNKKACKNDIAYNMMRMWQGALGVARRLLGESSVYRLDPPGACRFSILRISVQAAHIYAAADVLLARPHQGSFAPLLRRFRAHPATLP